MTGKIFLKLIAGVFCLLLFALVTVDYFATNVAKDNYIQDLTGQLAEKGRMLALTFATRETPDVGQVRRMAQAAGGRIAVVRRRYWESPHGDASRTPAGVSGRDWVGHPAECHDRCVISIRRCARRGRRERHTDRVPTRGDQPAGQADPR